MNSISVSPYIIETGYSLLGCGASVKDFPICSELEVVDIDSDLKCTVMGAENLDAKQKIVDGLVPCHIRQGIDCRSLKQPLTITQSEGYEGINLERCDSLDELLENIQTNIASLNEFKTLFFKVTVEKYEMKLQVKDNAQLPRLSNDFLYAIRSVEDQAFISRYGNVFIESVTFGASIEVGLRKKVDKQGFSLSHLQRGGELVFSSAPSRCAFIDLKENLKTWMHSINDDRNLEALRVTVNDIFELYPRVVDNPPIGYLT